MMFKAVLIVLLGFVPLISAAQSKNQPIQVETKNDSIYQYHQIEVNTVSGLVGTITLNGRVIHDFDIQSTQLSRNLKIKQLNNGVNKLELNISGIPENIELGFFDEAALTIIYHCINEKVFASEETQFFKVLWNPEQMQQEANIEYLFNLHLK